MNHNVHRHLSMSCPAMRDGLRLMLEGSGKFEVAGRARDCAERTASATCSGCALRRSSSAESLGTTPPTRPSSSPCPASATGWRRGRRSPSRSCLRAGAAAIIRAALTLPPTTEMEKPPTLEGRRLVGPKPGGSRSLSLY